MAQIVDQFGRPIQRQTLAEPQTSRVRQLHREFADHPARGITPARLASILTSAEEGDLIAQCDLFDDMEERDAHIFSEMSKRKRAVLTVEWDIVPPRNASAAEKKDAAYVKELIQDVPNFEDVLLDMADAIGNAFSCLEMEWQRLGSEWLPKCITHRPQRWFTVDRETRTQLLLRNLTADGEPLQPFGWIVHTHRAKSGYIARSGLHRVLSWPYLFKNYAVRDLAEFLEIYGLPLRLGKYGSGASPEEKATLLQAVVNIGHNAAGIIPEGMAIDFQAAADGTNGPFEAMIEWCERSVSKAVIGATLTSEAKATGLGSGLANVHNEVRHDIKASDCLQLGGTLTRDIVYPLLALNRGGIADMRRCPRFKFLVRESEDVKALAEAVERFVNMGLRVPTDWAYDKAQIPKPAEGQEVLQPRATPAPAPTDGPPAAARAVLRAKAADADTTDEMVAQLDERGRAAVAALIAPVRELVMRADSVEALRDGLIDLYAHESPERFAMLLEQALVAAELAGRYEAINGR